MLDLLPAVPAAVGRVLLPLGPERHVLHERAAERDVHDLAAAAHPEQRQAPVDDPLDEVELELVAVRIGQPQSLVGLLAVAVRLDVAPASDHDRVDDVELVVDRSLDAAQDERDAAGHHERPLEADALVVAEVVVAHRQADDRLSRAGSSKLGRGERFGGHRALDIHTFSANRLGSRHGGNRRPGRKE